MAGLTADPFDRTRLDWKRRRRAAALFVVATLWPLATVRADEAARLGLKSKTMLDAQSPLSGAIIRTPLA